MRKFGYAEKLGNIGRLGNIQKFGQMRKVEHIQKLPFLQKFGTRHRQERPHYGQEFDNRGTRQEWYKTRDTTWKRQGQDR